PPGNAPRFPLAASLPRVRPITVLASVRIWQQSRRKRGSMVSAPVFLGELRVGRADALVYEVVPLMPGQDRPRTGKDQTMRQRLLVPASCRALVVCVALLTAGPSARAGGKDWRPQAARPH